MTVFAVIYSSGISTGYRELVGLCSTQDKAEEMKRVDMRSTLHSERHYSIQPVKIDETLKIVYDEW